MDYLDSIDCSLEDFQAMLYGKPGLDVDPFEVKMTARNARVFLETFPTIIAVYASQKNSYGTR